MLYTLFDGVHDKRRGQGQRYKLKHILLFSVLAILSGANSYRAIGSYIQNKYDLLNDKFGLNWKKVPSYTTVRNIILSVDPYDLRNSLRVYSDWMMSLEDEEYVKENTAYKFLSLDGKTIRGSFDNLKDQGAIQLFSIFNTNKKIILAHEEITENKTNEIPIAQKLIENLNLTGYVLTLDALHCQKKH